MAKTVIKEVIIMLLLLIAILLVFGLLFYDYIPTNKMVPNKVAYSVPENIKEELSTSFTDEAQNVIVTYELDDTDLNMYQKSQSYKSGKPNPFGVAEVEQPATGTNSNNGGTTNSGGTNNNQGASTDGSKSTNTANGSNSTGTFFDNGSNK